MLNGFNREWNYDHIKCKFGNNPEYEFQCEEKSNPITGLFGGQDSVDCNLQNVRAPGHDTCGARDCCSDPSVS